MPYKDPKKRALMQREYHKRYYRKRRDYFIKKAQESNARLTERNREYVNEYLRNNPCVDCGESDPILLEFDHVKDKKVMNISDTIYNQWSIKRIQKEIDKCEVRCANCHRKVTHERRKQKKD